MEEAKDNLKLVEAKLTMDIIENPDKYDLGKTTKDAVGSCVIVQDQYQAAVEELRECKKEVGLLEAMVEALEHRKKALEKEVELHGQQYWAKPRANDEDTRDSMALAEMRAAHKKRRNKD